MEHYKTLGVSKQDSIDDIKKKYRTLTMINQNNNYKLNNIHKAFEYISENHNNIHESNIGDSYNESTPQQYNNHNTIPPASNFYALPNQVQLPPNQFQVTPIIAHGQYFNPNYNSNEISNTMQEQINNQHQIINSMFKDIISIVPKIINNENKPDKADMFKMFLGGLNNNNVEPSNNNDSILNDFNIFEDNEMKDLNNIFNFINTSNTVDISDYNSDNNNQDEIDEVEQDDSDDNNQYNNENMNDDNLTIGDIIDDTLHTYYSSESSYIDISKTIDISLDDVYNGCTKTIEYSYKIYNINNTTNNNQEEIQNIDIDIPKGFDESEIIIKYMGNIYNIDDNSKRTNLILKVNFIPHETIKKQDLDSIIDVNITFPESIFGFTRKIDYFNKRFNITIDNKGLVINSGDKKVIKNMGFEKDNIKGNLIIQFTVDKYIIQNYKDVEEVLKNIIH